MLITYLVKGLMTGVLWFAELFGWKGLHRSLSRFIDDPSVRDDTPPVI